jgi:hypothetical protein
MKLKRLECLKKLCQVCIRTLKILILDNQLYESNVDYEGSYGVETKKLKTRNFVFAFHLLQKRERGIPLGALRSVACPSAIPVLKCRRFQTTKIHEKKDIVLRASLPW